MEWKLPAVVDAIDRTKTASSLSRQITNLWIIGILVLLPVDLGQLPLNVNLVDAWIVLGLPFLWLSFAHGRKLVGLSYALPMWVIMVASLVSTFAAPRPSLSLIVMLKELFLFVWFISLASLLAGLEPVDLRLMLWVWLVTVVLHGCLVLAQFMSPPLWQMVSRLMDRSSSFAHYRPSGLFANANKAAFFHLFGYVPLLLLKLPRSPGVILAIVLLAPMLATGSMAAAIAFTVGLLTATALIALSGRVMHVFKVLARVALVIPLLVGLAYPVVASNQRLEEHLTQILFGRSERSSAGRFDLWQRGVETYLNNDVVLFGIGPENFRVVDYQGKQLHNDLIAFSVERGLVGALGLVSFALLAASKAFHLLRLGMKQRDRVHVGVVVFFAAVLAAVVESLTHQSFHYHELWLVLALQEAVLFRLLTDPSTGVRETPPVR